MFGALAPAGGGIGGVAGPGLPPEVEAELAEGVVRPLDRLGDDELRRIALWKMDWAEADADPEADR